MGKININEVIKKTVKETIKEINKSPVQQGRNYFKDTEKLLYAYPALELQAQEIEKDINDLRREGYTGKSKDIVKMPAGGGQVLTKNEIQGQRIKNRQSSLERTKKEVDRIERALGQIKDDPGYKVIEFKYFKEMTNEQIAEELSYSVRTVIRHKNRLINKLKIYLFGIDALK